MIAARFSGWWWWSAHLLLLSLGIGSSAGAISSPHTLRHLLQISHTVVELNLVQGPHGSLQFTNALVGSAPLLAPTLVLTNLSEADEAWFSGRYQIWNPEMMWFEGDFSSLTHPQSPPPVLLHFRGRWFGLSPIQPGRWRVQSSDAGLPLLWNGGTDMLREAVRWLLRFPNSDLTHAPNVEWAEPERIGFVGRQAHSIIAVDLHRTGTVSLFIPSPAGDILLQRGIGDESFTTRALDSRSDQAVWVDIDGDGRLDLASARGDTLQFWRQLSPGKFTGTNFAIPKPRPIRTLAAWGQDKMSGLMVIDDARPRILLRRSERALIATNLVMESLQLKTEPDFATSATVADFNGDSWPDIAQFCPSGLVLWPGTPEGKFHGPQLVAVTPEGRGVPCLADFDADGSLDLLRPSNDGVQLWQNNGSGGFREVQRWSGDLARVGGRYFLPAQAGDFNNDGWHDVLLLSPDGPPQLLFNRGFRSFARAPGPPPVKGLERLNEGQRAGMLTDVDNDGAQDLVLVLTDGEVWLIRGLAPSHTTFSVRTILDRDAPWGPVLAQATSNGRPLGAWPVVSGGAGAFFGLHEPGPVLISWQFPGQPKRSQTVVLEEGEARLWLRPDGATQF